jgi:hypothetical protein
VNAVSIAIVIEEEDDIEVPELNAPSLPSIELAAATRDIVLATSSNSVRSMISSSSEIKRGKKASTAELAQHQVVYNHKQYLHVCSSSDGQNISEMGVLISCS